MNNDCTLKTQDIEIVSRKYQLVLSGKSWGNIVEYLPESIPHILRKGVVFSRMSSHQKQQLIEELKNLGYYVGKYLHIFENRSCYTTKNMKF